MPRRIELSIQYTPRGQTTPQTAQFPSFSGSPLSTPQNYAVPQLSAPHHLSTFPNSYMRNDSAHPDQYHSVGSVLGEVVENSNRENDEHNDQY